MLDFDVTRAQIVHLHKFHKYSFTKGQFPQNFELRKNVESLSESLSAQLEGAS